MYRENRNYENIQKYNFGKPGKYDIPNIEGTEDIHVTDFISFNYAKTANSSKDKGVHFYIDDYQFIRVWNDIDRYVPILAQYGCVLSPDFSLYTDFPVALQIYNHYRKHYIGAYFQMHGIQVIPTICWADKNSFEWCFDGEPSESVVSVSSVGCMKSRENKEKFMDGYNEMINRLHPTKIIFYGDIPDECTGNIVHVKKYTDKFKEAKMNGW